MPHFSRRSLALGLALAASALSWSCTRPSRDGDKPKPAEVGTVDIKLSEGGAGMEGIGRERKKVGEVTPVDDATIPWGGTVNNFESSDPSNLNPVTYRDGASARLLRRFYPQLARVHVDDLELYPYMAESLPTISEDKLTYTWRLRRGIKWLHDGSPVTAHDYRASWLKIKDPAVDAPHRRAEYDRFADLVVLDEHTFEIRMKEPYFGGVWLVGYHLFPIPAKVFADMPGKDFNEHPIRREPMPFGMWRMEKWNSQVDLVLVRDDTNAEVFAPATIDTNVRRPHVDRLRTVFVKDLVAAFEMMRAGEIDVMAMSPDDWVMKTKDPSFQARFHKAEYYLPQWIFLSWNMRKPMFQDIRVRKAMTLLTRRQEVVDTVRHGYATLINGPNFIYSRAYDDSYPPLPFDPAEAARLLAEAGWKDTDTDGWLDKDGVRFAFELMNPSTKSPESDALMLQFADDARKVGVEVKQRPLEWTTFLENLYDRKFDCAYLSFVPDPTYEDPYELWHSSQVDQPRSSNHSGYSNPAVDALLERARLEFDDDKRYEILRELHRTVGNDHPYTWLWCGESLVAVNRRWSNVQVHKLGVRYEEWYLTEGGRSTPAIPQ